MNRRQNIYSKLHNAACFAACVSVFSLVSAVSVSAKEKFVQIHKVSGGFNKSSDADADKRLYEAYSVAMIPEYTYQFRFSFPPNKRASFFPVLRVLDSQGRCIARGGGMLNFWPEKPGMYTVVVSAWKPGKTGDYILTVSRQKSTSFQFEETWKVKSKLKELDVENNPIYQKGGGKTYCNKFVADLSSSLSETIPAVLTHTNPARRWLLVYYDKFEQEQRKKGPTFELNANMMQDWLNSEGRQQKWLNIGKAKHELAQSYANRGYLVISTWRTAEAWSHGHIAVVRPHSGFENGKGPRIAQAGGTNFNDDNTSKGFGTGKYNHIVYFVHKRKLKTWQPGDHGNLNIKNVDVCDVLGKLPSKANKKPVAKSKPKPKKPKRKVWQLAGAPTIELKKSENRWTKQHSFRYITKYSSKGSSIKVSRTKLQVNVKSGEKIEGSKFNHTLSGQVQLSPPPAYLVADHVINLKLTAEAKSSGKGSGKIKGQLEVTGASIQADNGKETFVQHLGQDGNFLNQPARTYTVKVDKNSPNRITISMLVDRAGEISWTYKLAKDVDAKDALKRLRGGGTAATTVGSSNASVSRSKATPPAKVVFDYRVDQLANEVDRLAEQQLQLASLSPGEDGWSATFRASNSPPPQRLINSKRFDVMQQQMKPLRQTEWNIVDIGFDGSSWAAALAKPNQKHSQLLLSGGSTKELGEKIKKWWKQKYRVTSLTHGRKNWIAVLTKDTSLGRQAYKSEDDWSEMKVWISEQWKKQRDISSIAYHDGRWMIVMTESSDSVTQRWIKRTSYAGLQKQIRAESDRGYTLTLLAGHADQWLAVVSK